MSVVHMRFAGLLSAVVLMLTACGDSDSEEANPAPAVTQQAQASLVGTPSTVRDKDGVTSSDSTPVVPANRGRALGFLPDDALLALRFPDLNGHSEEWAGTALRQAMSRLHLGGVESLIEEAEAELRAAIAAEFPPANQAWDLFADLRGELVVALVRVFPATVLMNSSEFPAAVVAHMEVGEQEAAVRKVLDSMCAAADHVGLLTSTAAGRYEWKNAEARLDLRLDGGWLHASLEPASGMTDGLDDWLSLAPNKSLLAAEVVRSAPVPSGKREVSYFEAFMNLAPVWSMLKTFAPPDAQQVIGVTKVNQIQGVSMVSCIDGPMFRDHVTLHSPGGHDLLSRMLIAPPLDRSWGKYAFRGAEQVGVLTLDLEQVYRVVRDALPATEQAEFDQGVQGLQAMMGVDLHRDLLANLGPHFLLATRGDLVSATTQDEVFEAALVIQLQDVKATQALFDRFLQGTGLIQARKAYKVGGLNCFAVPLPIPDAPPWLNLSYAFVDDAVVLCTAPGVFEKCYEAAQGGAGETTFQRTLENLDQGTWCLSMQSTAAQVKSLYTLVVPNLQAAAEAAGAATGGQALDTVGAFPALEDVLKQMRTIPDGSLEWKRLPEGLRLESRNAIPNAWFAGAPLAVAASVALPNLMSARHGANESAAIASLRNVAAAQEQFRGMASADRDGDGRGEYGYFGELAGTRPLPNGRSLNPPMLSSSWGQVARGTVQKSGYYFRAYLASPTGLPISEMAEGGSPVSLRADGAERSYAVYAWPIEFGVTGSRVFVMDGNGKVFFTSNDGPGQFYSGPDHAPAPDASFIKAKNILERGGRSVRRGQDGALWMQLD